MSHGKIQKFRGFIMEPIIQLLYSLPGGYLEWNHLLPFIWILMEENLIILIGNSISSF